MLTEFNSQDKFIDYYEQWIKVYKENAVREVTMEKYRMSLTWLKKLIPELTMAEMNRITYQSLLNSYAESHERQTTMDFHHQIKGAVLDAVDEGLISRDPTRKVIIKGKAQGQEAKVPEPVRNAHPPVQPEPGRRSKLGLAYPAYSQDRTEVC